MQLKFHEDEFRIITYLSYPLFTESVPVLMVDQVKGCRKISADVKTWRGIYFLT